MPSALKPITVWGKSGPNPPKVALTLEELGLPYEIVDIPLSDVKNPEYTAINPNGRLPSIKDPNNNDIIVWESGAIIEYLVEKYDPEHKLSFKPGTPDYYHAKQYLFFQVSGQGPYFGQYAWFKKFHSEKVPSAQQRYQNEIQRVSGVLEGVLKAEKEKQGGGDGPWLVGNKYSYADLAFLSWYVIMPLVTPKEDFDLAEFPIMHDWIKRMVAREPVKAGFSANGTPIEQVLK
ncbi:hypothetical protein PV08_06606 [Exophiala spinifera]|uniref:Glutathione S-transferase n=1 Tax=Exophiala spinifera TaxID=91928 RepID=A0A0D1YFH3_9EURO|nr:uncharacterized protein PV08_06606 [Exophiala spinifera]KIW13826.1 hypothetical protein PV08_06606 [Exophiala spinifera]